MTRQTLSNIDQDDERRAWYAGDEDPEDERVVAAISGVDLDL